MKKCFKCGEEKSLSEYYEQSRMRDGHLNKCKSCAKIDSRKHRLRNIDAVRGYDKLRANLPHRVELRRQTVEQYAIAYPDRVKANNAVSNAVRDGRLQKWPCMVCGAKAVAHHPDYSRPLSVVWLCQPHHKQAHALVGVIERERAEA